MDSRNRSIEQNRQTQLPGNIILWFGVLGATVLLLPLFLLSRSWRQDVVELQVEVIPLETAVAIPTDPSSNAALNQQLITLNEQINQLGTLEPTLDALDVAWPPVVQAVRAYDGTLIELLSVSQSTGQLTIRGRAVDETAVLNYANTLEMTGQFERVIVQSLQELDAPFIPNTPTPTRPTPTPRPTDAPTPTPSRTPIPPTATPDERDEFEWDNQQAQPAFVGSPQTRNFFPNFDVDNAFYLAKAGRFYHIRTLSLAPGVDTFLTVTIGDQTLTNDDAEPGTLASFIEVQAPPDEDVNVFIRITNRGSFGPDKTYQLLVQEIVPTATPLEPTITPTPDLRDEYEPDEPPTLLAIDEIQFHTFYPSVDVDHLQLLIKEGRGYRIFTESLAPGIDTRLEVDIDTIVLKNDDYLPLGSDDLSSAVCFTAPRDSVALIDVYNNSQQYDPDQEYIIGAEEVPFLSDTLFVDFGTLAAGSGAVSESVQLQSNTAVSYTLFTETPWLQVDSSGGTTPGTFNITALTTDLQPGSYEGAVTVAWTDLCHQEIPVSLIIQEGSSMILPQHELVEKRPSRIQFKPPNQNRNAVEFVIVLEFKTE